LLVRKNIRLQLFLSLLLWSLSLPACMLVSSTSSYPARSQRSDWAASHLLPEDAEEEERLPQASSAEAKEKTAPTPEEALTALQESPGPQADDQLLGLWQKDLDKAMEKSPGQRQIQFSIPVVENERVRYFIELFRERERAFFSRALARSGKYLPMMVAILREEGLPEDLVYLSLIESGFSPRAYSRAKAAGPWQFIRGTGLRYGLKIDGWVDERRDPVKATRAAAAYLKDLHSQFGEWFLAAAAYNAGERRVEKAIRRLRTEDFWHLSQKRYLKRETRNYVPKFIAATLIARNPEKYGFGDIVYESPVDHDEVTITGALKLETAARLAQSTTEAIKELNPALRRDYTPPNEEGFVLRVPAGKGEIFAQAYETLPESEKKAKVRIVTHKVRRGETLASIARRYRQKVTQLMEMNNLKSRRLRVGQELIIAFGEAWVKN